MRDHDDGSCRGYDDIDDLWDDVKRSPIKRSTTPLRRTSQVRQASSDLRSGLKKAKRINPVSEKRRAERVERDAVRAKVLASGQCVLAGKWLGRPCGGPLTPHHLLKASQGGAYSEENLVPVCAVHNSTIEDYPLEAQALGMVRHAWETE